MEELTKTITYHYIIQGNIKFVTIEERNNFIKYCEYMMFSNYDKPLPIHENDCKDYFRSLYKYIEMMYETDIMEYEHLTNLTIDDYDDNNNEEEEADKDLYLKYNYIFK
jgi:hypothetical protein